MQRHHHPDRPGVTTGGLVWALIISIMFVVAGIAIPFFEVSRVQNQVRDLVWESNQTRQLLSTARRRITIMAIALREASQQKRRLTQEDVANAVAEIDGSRQRLPSLLSPAETRAWEHLDPTLETLSLEFVRVAEAIERGEFDTARVMLDRMLSLLSEAHEELTTLARLNEQEMEDILAVADRRLTLVRWLLLAVGALLLLGIGVVWVVAIRSLQQKQRALDHYVARVERANADLDAFAGRVAHDLRNTLAPVSMAAELLRSKPDSSDRVAEQLERTSSRAVRLIEGLLGFSRAGARSGREESASVRQEVSATIEELAGLTESVDATVRVELDEGYVRCSQGLLGVILTNVLNNALKYIEGQPRREVVVAGHPEDGCYRIEVRDTGPGIPKEALPQLFEPFFRVDENSPTPGSGIGLSTVQRIVHAHDGRIAIESTLGEGTTVCIWLPRAAAPAAQQHSSGQQDAGPALSI